MPIRALLMPCSTTSLVATFVALMISHLSFFSIVEMEMQVDEARFQTLCLIEKPLLNVSNPNFTAAEKLWRDELGTHKCNPNRDWLYANCAMKLADVISIRTNQVGKPQAAELEDLYKKAASSFENLQTRFEAASANQNLGSFYASHDRSKEAEYHYEKALDGYASKLGKFCFYAQQVATSLVDLYVKDERYEEAIALLTDEYQTLKARNPDCPGALSMVRLELGKVYYHMGRYREAKQIFKESILNGSPCLAHVTSYIAATEDNLGNFKSAENEYKNVIVYERSNLKQFPLPGGSSWNIANALESLATFYVEQNRSDEAVPLLQEAFAIRQNEFDCSALRPMSDDLRREALDMVAQQLASAYKQQGRQDWAKEVLKVAARYQK